MINKKGFTLVELLATIVIIAILSGIAVPNIIKMVNSGKESSFKNDAKQIIAKAKYYCRKNSNVCSGVSLDTLFSDVGLELDKKNAYGNEYTNDSYVNCSDNKCSIYLKDGTNCLGSKNSLIEESEIDSASIGSCSN